MNTEAERIEQLTLRLVGPLTPRDRATLWGRKSATRAAASGLGGCLPLPAPPPIEEDVTLHYSEADEVHPIYKRGDRLASKVHSGS